MASPRTYHTLTILPDGNVLVTGGGRTTDAIGVNQAVLAAELWSPTTETWTVMASMNAPRLYHSNAVLMPDARVLILTGEFTQLNIKAQELTSNLGINP